MTHPHWTDCFPGPRSGSVRVHAGLSWTVLRDLSPPASQLGRAATLLKDSLVHGKPCRGRLAFEGLLEETLLPFIVLEAQGRGKSGRE